MAPKPSGDSTGDVTDKGGKGGPDRTSGPFIRPMSDPVSDPAGTAIPEEESS